MSSLVAIILVGFVLGMRHATDPDHVIAVTTIVSRQRSIRSAAFIGAFWGVGHTITIMAVGAGIIAFNIVIPPRLGLTMELAVGIMLVLLGVLNLTGVTTRLTERFTPEVAGGHSHPHAHGDYIHNHLHGHEPGRHGHPESATPIAKLDRRSGPPDGSASTRSCVRCSWASFTALPARQRWRSWCLPLFIIRHGPWPISWSSAWAPLPG